MKWGLYSLYSTVVGRQRTDKVRDVTDGAVLHAVHADVRRLPDVHVDRPASHVVDLPIT